MDADVAQFCLDS